MKMIIRILLGIAGILVLLLIIAVFMRKEYSVHREIVINVPTEKVFNYIKQLKNQDYYNKWVMVDPAKKSEFKGNDGTVGFIYGWNGNKDVGEGEEEIKSIVEGKSIEMEIRFVRPMKSVAYVNMATESLGENQTKVTWSNSGKMIYPINIMTSMVEKMLAKDMDTSLLNLKNILEK